MDLLKLIQKIPIAPPIFKDAVVEKFGRQGAIPDAMFPRASFASRRTNPDGISTPQAIAHRGYKKVYPENTLAAFEDAVKVGAHALETDLHLSKDGVVVLSHDPDLKRCYGVEKRVNECDWDFLKTVRTTREPSQPMPRLLDLLELLSKPELKDTWLMLDIKFSDEPSEMMHQLAKTFTEVEPPAGGTKAWKDRIVLCYWTAEFLPLIHTHFPTWSIVNIGFSQTYSHQFLSLKESGFSMLQATAVSPAGRKFVRELRARNAQIFAWTVNDVKNMDTCFRQNFDGVVTDNVPEFLEFLNEREMERREGKEGKRYKWNMKLVLGYAFFNVWIWLFSAVLQQRFGTKRGWWRSKEIDRLRKDK